jgi:hypothetical protein
MVNQSSISPEQYALANKDYATEQAQMAQMIRRGSDRLAGGPAQGKTFDAGQGMQQYVAPTWSELLSNTAKKLVGGYEMGQGRRGMSEIQEKQDESAHQRGLIQAVEAQRAADQQAAENTRADTAADLSARRQAHVESQDDITNKRLEEQEATRKAERLEDLKIDKEQDLLDHEQKMELERLEAELEGGVAPLAGVSAETQQAVNRLDSSTERKRARDDLLTFRAMSDVLSDAYIMNQKGGSWTGGEQTAVDFAEWLAPASFEKTARGMANEAVFTEDEQDVRGRIANAVEQFKRNRTGANLTAIEQVLGEDWDPAAKGIDESTAIRRMVALQNYLNTSFEGMGLPRQDAWKAPGGDVGAPDPSGPSDSSGTTLDDEEEEIYRRFPHLRPK